MCIEIVNDDVGAFDQIEDRLIGLVGAVFCIGQIANRPVIVFHTIAGRVVGVVERRCSNGYTRFGIEGFAGMKIMKADFRLEYLERHWEQRRHHHCAENLADGVLREKMAGPDAKFVLGIEPGYKKRQADDVVQMGVGKKKVAVDRRFRQQRVAEVAEPGAGIKYQQMFAATDLQARRVAAIADRLRTRTCYAPAHPPEANIKIFIVGQTATPSPILSTSVHCYMG